MTTTTVYAMRVAMALALWLGLFPLARRAPSAAESPETATPCPSTGTDLIVGRVKTSQGSAIAGVTMTLTGLRGCSATTTTKTNGVYAFNKLVSGIYTVTPRKTTCTFTPPKGRADLTITPFALLNFTGDGSSCR